MSRATCIALLLALPAACARTAGRATDSAQTAAASSDAVARREVTEAMERYMVAARAVEADAIARFYAPTAVLFEPGIRPIHTRDSIRAFMGSFPGVRVDSAVVHPDTIEVFGSTALYWGNYYERLAFPGQPVSEQHGKFVVEWVRAPDGAWLIQRYYRIPLPAGKPPGTAEER